MNATMIVGYTADADAWHIECLAEAYRLPSDWDNAGLTARDHEGNEIHPIFASDEWDYVPTCGACFGEIEGASVVEADAKSAPRGAR